MLGCARKARAPSPPDEATCKASPLHARSTPLQVSVEDGAQAQHCRPVSPSRQQHLLVTCGTAATA